MPRNIRWTKTLEGAANALPSAGSIVAGQVALLPDAEAASAIAAGIAEDAGQAKQEAPVAPADAVDRAPARKGKE